MTKVCSVIPTRGGSKRLPKKNIKPLNGIPLIAYTIEASKKSKLIDEVWVATDSKEIDDVSTEFGANVLYLPEHLTKDTCASDPSVLYFAEQVDFDILVYIQATSPMVESKFLDEGVQKILNGECDSILSVSKDDRFYWDKDGNPINYDPLHRPRTQDKEPWYKETGSFYITTRERLMDSKCRLSGKTGYVVVPQVYSFEIDTEEDFELLEIIMRKFL
jgi:CMP-N-acetylneuraminic acid synthetase